jgi:hypothetical protein
MLQGGLKRISAGHGAMTAESIKPMLHKVLLLLLLNNIAVLSLQSKIKEWPIAPWKNACCTWKKTGNW